MYQNPHRIKEWLKKWDHLGGPTMFSGESKMIQYTIKAVKEDYLFYKGVNMWAFVQKKKRTLYILAELFLCKDWTHEAIANAVHNSNVNISSGYTNPDQYQNINLKEFDAVILGNHYSTKAVLVAKKYINYVEILCGVRPTKIHKIKYDDKFIFWYINADRIYIESPVLMHWLIATMRSYMSTDCSSLIQDIEEHLQAKINSMDNRVLLWALKNNIIEKLMLGHEKHIKPLKLTEVYPKKTELNYHSGFGLVALRDGYIAAPAYAKALENLMEDEYELF